MSHIPSGKGYMSHIPSSVSYMSHIPPSTGYMSHIPSIINLKQNEAKSARAESRHKRVNYVTQIQQQRH